jgi:large subunit ribosomal protein L21
VDSISAEVGSTVELGDVLLIASNGDVSVGRPTIEGARVIAEVIEHGRDRKIIVFKYKPKTRYRRRRGHRQGYTRLAVRQIVTAEGVIEAEEKPKRRAPAKAAAKPARRARKVAAAAEAPAAEALPVEAPPEAPEAAAKPARRARKAVPAAEAPAAEAPPVEASPEAPGVEAKPARRARTRKPAAETAPEATAAAPEAEAKPTRRTRARKAEAEAPAATEKPKRTRKKTEKE